MWPTIWYLINYGVTTLPSGVYYSNVANSTQITYFFSKSSKWCHLTPIGCVKRWCKDSILQTNCKFASKKIVDFALGCFYCIAMDIWSSCRFSIDVFSNMPLIPSSPFIPIANS